MIDFINKGVKLIIYAEVDAVIGNLYKPLFKELHGNDIISSHKYRIENDIKPDEEYYVVLQKLYSDGIRCATTCLSAQVVVNAVAILEALNISRKGEIRVYSLGKREY